MSLKRLKSVVHNFLETFTSRYSDYDGYWVFGHIVQELENEEVNLLKPRTDETNTQKDLIKKIAVEKFFQQLKKNRVNISHIEAAKLTIVKSTASKKGFVNGNATTGYEVSFGIKISTVYGSSYSKVKAVFVAPHPQASAFRSSRRL